MFWLPRCPRRWPRRHCGPAGTRSWPGTSPSVRQPFIPTRYTPGSGWASSRTPCGETVPQEWTFGSRSPSERDRRLQCRVEFQPQLDSHDRSRTVPGHRHDLVHRFQRPGRRRRRLPAARPHPRVLRGGEQSPHGLESPPRPLQPHVCRCTQRSSGLEAAPGAAAPRSRSRRRRDVTARSFGALGSFFGQAGVVVTSAVKALSAAVGDRDPATADRVWTWSASGLVPDAVDFNPGRPSPSRSPSRC